jgi:hypothetical protein
MTQEVQVILSLLYLSFPFFPCFLEVQVILPDVSSLFFPSVFYRFEDLILAMDALKSIKSSLLKSFCF